MQSLQALFFSSIEGTLVHSSLVLVKGMGLTVHSLTVSHVVT